MPQASPSVLLVRLDALGDALALAPLLAAFRERAITVDLVLCPNNAQAFAAGAVRHRLIAPFALRCDTVVNRRAIEAFAAELRPNAYSHVLVATEDSSGYRLAGAVASPVRIGFVNGWGKPLKRVWAQHFLTRSCYRSAGLDPKGPHECSVLFELGRALLGADVRPTKDAVRLRPLVLEETPATADFAAVQITDKFERLGFAFDDVIVLLRALRERFPLRLLAAEHERAYADRVARTTGLIVDRFDALPPWKAAIAQAAVLIAPDSGAIHLAGMVGTPTVAVFAPTRDFALQSARWAPWAAPYRILRGDDGWPERAVESAAALLNDRR